jgi:hypothetical protein
MKTISCYTLFLFLTFLNALYVKAQVMMDLESGLTFTGYSDVRIPGNQGTLFSLKEDLQANSEIYYRLRAGYKIKSRHTISVLFAPFETKSEGSLANKVLFQGVLFPENTLLKGSYKFNSYRLTYRYDFVNKPAFVFGLGFTAKIRDARIGLSSNGLTAEKTNVGFVPIINFRLFKSINDKIGLLLDGDALAAKQGRAEDVLIAVTYTLSDKLGIRAGYRILEGGADNAEVYNFALFNYASFGISYTFITKTTSNQFQ